MRSCIFDMSGVLSEEGFTPTGATSYDFRNLPGTSCYCDDDAASVLSAAAREFGPEGVHWIDIGDYHYLSKFFLESIREPFELLLIDHHSDRQDSAFGGILSCGNWVSNALLEIRSFRSLISIGPAATPSETISTTHITTLPSSLAATQDMTSLRSDLPLYISLDLDALSPGIFSTNWDQGDMASDELFAILSTLTSGRRIIGIDICGGLTEDKGACASTLALNRAFHLALESFIHSIRGFEPCSYRLD